MKQSLFSGVAALVGTLAFAGGAFALDQEQIAAQIVAQNKRAASLPARGTVRVTERFGRPADLFLRDSNKTDFSPRIAFANKGAVLTIRDVRTPSGVTWYLVTFEKSPKGTIGLAPIGTPGKTAISPDGVVAASAAWIHSGQTDRATATVWPKGTTRPAKIALKVSAKKTTPSGSTPSFTPPPGHESPPAGSRVMVYFRTGSAKNWASYGVYRNEEDAQPTLEQLRRGGSEVMLRAY
jgi:hypothetical protein